MIALLRLLHTTSGRRLPIAILLGVASGVSMTALLALINYAIEHRDERKVITGYAAIVFLLLLTRFVSRRIVVQLSEQALADLRKRISRRVLDAPLPTIEGLGHAKLRAALADDMVVVASGLTTLYDALVEIVIVIACLAYLTFLSSKVTAIVLGFIAVGGVTYRLASGIAARRYMRARDAQDRLFEGLDGVVAGAKELKLNQRRRGTFLERHVDSAADAFRLLQSRAHSSYDASAMLGFGVFLVAIGVVVFAPPKGVTPHMLAACILTTIYMNTCLDHVFRLMPVIGRAETIMTRLGDLGLALSPTSAPETNVVTTTEPRGTWKEIKLEGVCHEYAVEGEARPFRLDRIGLTIEPGTINFLIGGNGSGKSTLVKVLVGLYVPQSGTIDVDGAVVTDATREQYRQNFSAVFADYHLFRDFHVPPSEELLKRADAYLKILKLSHVVKIVDGALSTTKLSTGQRKRLALLSAYLEDRRVYVFDEWASDQDPRFRDFFYTELLPDLAQRGKAVVCVTHDEKYFASAHKKIKLAGGRIIHGDTQVFLNSISRPNVSSP